jgi:hypothetical protein
MIECLGILLSWISKQENISKTQSEKLFDELEARFRDNNSFVRTKVLHVLCNLVQ